MTTMLEKMAKAITDEETRQIAGWTRDNESRDPIAIARVALLTIRDLDSGDINDGGLAALVAGKTALYSCSEDPELADARGCFHAMIDAILGEKPETTT